jgi:hypothetical protein
MDKIAEKLKAYIDTHPIDLGDSDCETVLDQLYQAYAESHESAPPEITEGFQELEKFLCDLPLENNNTVFNLCCRLCSAYEHKAFVDGFQYGSNLMLELNSTELGARNQSTEEQKKILQRNSSYTVNAARKLAAFILGHILS